MCFYHIFQIVSNGSHDWGVCPRAVGRGGPGSRGAPAGPWAPRPQAACPLRRDAAWAPCAGRPAGGLCGRAPSGQSLAGERALRPLKSSRSASDASTAEGPWQRCGRDAGGGVEEARPRAPPAPVSSTCPEGGEQSSAVWGQPRPWGTQGHPRGEPLAQPAVSEECRARTRETPTRKGRRLRLTSVR